MRAEPGFLYRSWWSLSEPVRLLVRFAVERWLRRSWWMPLFSLIRLALHAIAGAPLNTILIVGWLLLFPINRQTTAAVFVLIVLAEVWMKIAQARGRGSVLLCLRLAWKFHRVWPRVWADYAAKTRQVQAEVGGLHGEPTASARLRPVVDHPRMTWRFWVNWPVVTFRVGVPPGRTFAEFERALPAMSANMSWIHGLDLEYETDRSSFGLLHVSFVDVLASTRTADWINNTQPEPAVVDNVTQLRRVERQDDIQ